jgi:pyridoxamine 5'-phosphate oxidase
MLNNDKLFLEKDPIFLFKKWMNEAVEKEINDPNAIALSTVDDTGFPNVRMVLLKDIDGEDFLFYTNYGSVKSSEIFSSQKLAFVIHWKSLRRQIRVRGLVAKEEGKLADNYFSSRSLKSRIGAWASKQSRPIESREVLLNSVEKFTKTLGENPKRPHFWGGFRVTPLEIEFWADGPSRLHDRYRWCREKPNSAWTVTRLQP